MADQLYPIGAAHILGQATKIDFVADTIKTLLYGGSFNAAHEFVSNLTGGSIVARSSALTGKTVTLGVFDANDVTFSSVTGTFTHAIIYKDDGVSDSSSPLGAIFDVTSFTGSGGSVTLVFSASGLFSIAS